MGLQHVDSAETIVNFMARSLLITTVFSIFVWYQGIAPYQEFAPWHALTRAMILIGLWFRLTGQISFLNIVVHQSVYTLNFLEYVRGQYPVSQTASIYGFDRVWATSVYLFAV